MEFILLDWTRMGRVYCLAGAVFQAGQYRIVRPLPAKAKGHEIGNQGWSPFLFDGHRRWEIFELVQPVPAQAIAPHLEDVWVASLRSVGRVATREQRRAVLLATLSPPGKPIFGTALTHGQQSSFVEPGQGERSLASVIVDSADLQFTALWRDGADHPDHRVSLILPDGGRRMLPVKDHFLLRRAEKESSDIDEQITFLTHAVRALGSPLLVRLGLSRSFPAAPGKPGKCWLMADGFFDIDDPQS